MEIKSSRLFMSIFFFVFGCIFLVSEDKVQARNLDYYGLSKYESRTQSLKQGRVEKLSKKTPHITLRSSFEDLSVSQVHAIPNKSIRKFKKFGFYGHSTISHDYKVETINGEKVVIDHVTGLMWHQSGSRLHMNWAKAKQWIKDLNSSEYAGYNDWRLPTVEEAVSLLESAKKSDNLYIDTVFDKNQLYIWTGDSYGSRTAWVVSFRNGQVTWIRIDYRNYVRPIRTMK